jgi:hypothetical protein
MMTFDDFFGIQAKKNIFYCSPQVKNGGTECGSLLFMVWVLQVW